MSSSSPVLWTSREADAVTGGRSTDSWAASGVSLNMEDLKPGDLFIATLEDDLDAVFRRGASAVIAPFGGLQSAAGPVLRVANVFQALQDLAGAARFRAHGRVIAVQGRKEREVIAAALSRAAVVHAAGKHQSLSLAQMPDDCCFGVFGFTPAVRPDIAVITDGAQDSAAVIFSTMKRSALVLINAQSPGAADVMASARAAGLTEIHLYAGEPVLAARMILEASGFPAHSLPSPGSAGNVTVAAETRAGFEAFAPKAVFRVSNLIDCGFGKKMAILNAYDGPAAAAGKTAFFSPPQKLDNLHLVYASPPKAFLANPAAALARHDVQAAPIVPDVAAPGDFMIFGKAWKTSKSVFAEALRLVPSGLKKGTHHHAL